MAQQPIAIPTFDIKSRARQAAVALRAVIVTVLAISSAQSQTLTVLHTFTGPDGREPIAGVTMDAAGNLYGTTYYGGANDVGLVHKLAHRGPGWVYTSLYQFTDGADGGNPAAGLILESAGNLYGTTSGSLGGDGSVFEITP